MRIGLSFNLCCTNYKCPHNLFWVGLKLDRKKIRITDKAREIRNCCCLIRQPWTPDEISEAWGLKKETIIDFEERGLSKFQKKTISIQ